jgi:hypothetical protein
MWRLKWFLNEKIAKKIKFTLEKEKFPIFFSIQKIKNDKFFPKQNTQVVISYDKRHCYHNNLCECSDIISISMNLKKKAKNMNFELLARNLSSAFVTMLN